MRRLPILFVLLWLCAFAGTAQARSAPLLNPEPLNIPAGIDQAAVADAIKRALGKRDWQITEEQSGQIDATLHFDDHVASIRINYDERQVRWAYVDSVNLNYGTKRGVTVIHPNYMHWVDYVVADVANRFALGLMRAAGALAEDGPLTDEDPVIRADPTRTTLGNIVELGVPDGKVYRASLWSPARSVTVSPGAYSVRVICSVYPFQMFFDVQVTAERGNETVVECLGVTAHTMRVKTTQERLPARTAASPSGSEARL